MRRRLTLKRVVIESCKADVFPSVSISAMIAVIRQRSKLARSVAKAHKIRTQLI